MRFEPLSTLNARHFKISMKIVTKEDLDKWNATLTTYAKALEII